MFVASLLSRYRKGSIHFAWWVHISGIKYCDGRRQVSEFDRFKKLKLLFPSMECIPALSSVCFVFFFGEVAVGVGGSTHSWRLSFYKIYFYILLFKRQLWVRPIGGWNSTLQAAWYVRHAHWAHLCYVPFVILWRLWITSTIWYGCEYSVQQVSW